MNFEKSLPFIPPDNVTIEIATGKLQVKAIAISKVTGLQTALDSKIDKLVAGVVGNIPTIGTAGILVDSGTSLTSIVGGMKYQGTWNANTNSPTLASGIGTQGYYYVVSVDGTTNLDGITDWKIGDWAVYNGTAWEKVDNTDKIVSVFGRTGAVVATTNDYTWAQINKATSSIADITTRSHTSLTDIGTLTHSQIELSLNGKQTYHGFVNRIDSVIAMNSSNLEITTASDYDIYINGVLHTIDVTDSVSVTNDKTLHFVYFDANGELQISTSAWSITSLLVIPVATVFKDGSTYMVSEERHGYERNLAWHDWAHDTIGARYKSGLTGTFNNTTLSITQGVVYDEDLEVDTGGTITNCALWYQDTGLTTMRVVANITTPYSVSAGNLQYDNAGTLTTVPTTGGGRYVTNFVYATTDQDYPIYIVVGQSYDDTLEDARNAPLPNIYLATAEWKLIYKVIYRNVAGTPTYVEAIDMRSVSTGPASTAISTSHASLIDKDLANSHPATAISVDASGFSGNLSGTDTNVQLALATIDAMSTGHVIESDGTPLTQRANLNFIGFTVEDDSGNDATKVTADTGSYFDTFVLADLDVNHVLTVTHNLDEQHALIVVVEDENGKAIQLLDEITYVDADNLTIDLTSYYQTMTAATDWYVRIIKFGGSAIIGDVLSNPMTTAADIIVGGVDGAPTRLAKGTAYQHLGMNSGATAQEWQASLQSLMTAEGDIVYASAANTPARLAKGTDGHVLTMTSGTPAWQAASGGGVDIGQIYALNA